MDEPDLVASRFDVGPCVIGTSLSVFAQVSTARRLTNIRLGP